MHDHHKSYKTYTLNYYISYKKVHFYYYDDFYKYQNPKLDFNLMQYVNVVLIFYLYDVNNHIFYKNILFMFDKR